MHKYLSRDIENIRQRVYTHKNGYSHVQSKNDVRMNGKIIFGFTRLLVFMLNFFFFTYVMCVAHTLKGKKRIQCVHTQKRKLVKDGI